MVQSSSYRRPIWCRASAGRLLARPQGRPQMPPQAQRRSRAMKTVSITIDGRHITASEGQTLLWAALANGMFIPNLCAMEDAGEPEASCRLCFVEVEGYAQPVTACTEVVREGMVVNTCGPRALRLARTAAELLLASDPLDCGRCPANRACALQRIAVHLGLKLKSRRLRRLL